ncbi:hypothetical protein D5018_05145 [Parashewanella curva]|uniref:Single Cache domain-containing protein n=1 Tax=Parashewanella curva TaxID=2338552 RepID=A0A3L8PZW3_9GAMM|nr:cache domain-containing protein [Parashewanella curva]RLV60855.1 hypothetical protein D5018_05145 [Parashewanella curva]
MKKWSIMLVAFTLALLLSAPVLSIETDNSQGFVHSWHFAKQNIKRAKAYIKSNGREAYFQALKAKKFSDPNYHMFAIDYRGNFLAHPIAQLNGVNGWKLRDPNRIYMVREMVKIARNNGRGWLEYQSINPYTGKEASQLVYIERVNNRFFIGIAMH